MSKILILIFSRYGHIATMGRAVAEGVNSVPGAIAVIKQVPPVYDQTSLQDDIPVATVEELPEYDGIIFGTPTHFGNMAGEMKCFIDTATSHWVNQSLAGKIGSIFTSTGSQHGGHEAAILSSQIPLMHMGMMIVGLPYIFKGQLRMDEITGCSPYGAGTVADGDGSRQPSDNELAGARFQGQHVAQTARALAIGRAEQVAMHTAE